MSILQNTGINVCQSLLLVHLIRCGWPYTVMFNITKLYFDNQVSCLIRGWSFNQVQSLKYFSSGAIAPVHLFFDSSASSFSVRQTFACLPKSSCLLNFFGQVRQLYELLKCTFCLWRLRLAFLV